MSSPGRLYYKNSAETFFSLQMCIHQESQERNQFCQVILSQRYCTKFGSSDSSQLQSDHNSPARSQAAAMEGSMDKEFHFSTRKKQTEEEGLADDYFSLTCIFFVDRTVDWLKTMVYKQQ